MAKVNFVKKARKDNQVVKKGESYYWWQFYRQPKMVSKTRPTRAQTINSPFLSAVAALEDQCLCAIESPEEIEDIVNEIEELRDQTQESLENMPEGLQEGDVGILLQERTDYLEEWQTNIESLKEQFEDDWTDKSEDEKQSFRDDISCITYEGE